MQSYRIRHDTVEWRENNPSGMLIGSVCKSETYHKTKLTTQSNRNRMGA